jgi:hypothetical protein
MEWQPISTAPKDGTKVLIAWHLRFGANPGWHQGVSFFANGKWKRYFNGPWPAGTPSHWRHLGPPPANPFGLGQ